MTLPPVALTIAGSDPSGGAGIQADLKTFAAFGVYGTSVLTCATAQSTVGLRAVVRFEPGFVAAQLDAVLEDLPVAAAKTGMLGDGAAVEVVAVCMAARPALPLVVDPVMVATSGDALIDDAALGALRTLLLPRAALVTPNLREAEVLAGGPIDSQRAVHDAARAILALGPRAVLIKGGHAEGPACDVLLDEQGFLELEAERLAVGATHGSGCTLSAAITAGLAGGDELRRAVARAKRFVHEAIRCALPLGHGARPLDHRVRPEPACPGAAAPLARPTGRR